MPRWRKADAFFISACKRYVRSLSRRVGNHRGASSGRNRLGSACMVGTHALAHTKLGCDLAHQNHHENATIFGSILNPASRSVVAHARAALYPGSACRLDTLSRLLCFCSEGLLLLETCGFSYDTLALDRRRGARTLRAVSTPCRDRDSRRGVFALRHYRVECTSSDLSRDESSTSFLNRAFGNRPHPRSGHYPLT